MAFDDISNHVTANVRKGLKGSLFIARYATAMVTETDLFDASGGLQALPAGWEDAGYLTEAGIRIGRTSEVSETPSWQSQTPVRSDKTSDEETLQADLLETKRTALELATGQDLSATTISATRPVLSFQKPAVPADVEYRLLAVMADTVGGEEFVLAIGYPRVKITDYSEQAIANSDDGFQWGFTFDALFDSTAGYSKDTMLGGAALGTLTVNMGFSAAA